MTEAEAINSESCRLMRRVEAAGPVNGKLQNLQRVTSPKPVLRKQRSGEGSFELML